MTRNEPTYRRSQGGVSIVVIAALSLAIHGVFAATAEFSFGSKSEPSPTTELSNVEFAFSCSADANLALAAQEIVCLTTGLASRECQRKAWNDYKFDLMVCDGLIDSDTVESEEIAFMRPEEIDNIEPKSILDVEPIDELEAAKLLEEQIEDKVAAAQMELSNPLKRGQVVEVLAPDLEVVPDNARFLSEFNTKVEKESVARGTTEKMISEPAPRELPVSDNPSEIPEDPTPSSPKKPSEIALAESLGSEGKPGQESTPNSSPLLAMRATEFRAETKAGETSGSDALADNGLAAKRGNHSDSNAGQSAQEGRESTQAGTDGTGIPLNLRPSEEMLTRAMGGGSVDKLDGVESGENTALNSKKWKFASFFNRMKRQVAQNWHPAEVFLRRDPTGKVYGTKNRETVLELYLKPDGRLDRFVILQSSGVDFLDSEAAAAFERAQPFPNPPSGLLDVATQRIRFSFGFHFQVGSRSDSWRVFRKR